jgi:SAM-dependent methyltransferase
MNKKRTEYFSHAAAYEYSTKARQYSEKDIEKWKTPSFTAEQLVRIVSEIKPDRILELGVGTGRYFPYLSGRQYTGVDISSDMLDYARARESMLLERGFNSINLRLSELQDFLITLPDEEMYDFIFSIGCIGYHVPVGLSLFISISKILAPNGYLFLQTTQQSMRYKLKSILKHWKTLLLSRDDNAHFFLSTTKEQLRTVAKKSGFELVWMQEDEKKWYDRPLLLSLYKKTGKFS